MVVACYRLRERDLPKTVRPADHVSETAPALRRKTLTREAWIAAALKVLEKRGIADVKIDVLAKQFKVTRGSFYFHFSSIKDLREALLEEWRARNCRPFEALAKNPHPDGLVFFEIIVKTWVNEDPFSPLLDLAVRDWSRGSRKLADEMAAADDLRIALLEKSFLALDYPADEALVRARITYFHQIGHYTLYFRESAADRKRYQPIYGKVLLGPRGEEAEAQQAARQDQDG